MPKIKYRLKLNSDEREELGRIARSQKAAGMKIKRAKALLAMDKGEKGLGLKDDDVAQASSLGVASVRRLRARACEVGPLKSLERRKRMTPPVEPKMTGEVEGHLVALSCSEPPEGSSRWTLRLLADKLVELELVDSISGETVRRTLKKTGSSHGGASSG